MSRSAVFGAAVGVTIVATVIGFDNSAMGTMIERAPGNTPLASLFVGGLAKGATIGFVFGMAGIQRLDRVMESVSPRRRIFALE